MSNSFFSNSFTVSSAPYSTDTDTFLNVIRRRESFAFRSRVTSDTVGINYAVNSAISSGDTLFIADRSTSLTANRIENQNDYTVAVGVSSYIVETDRFLVTDVFTPSSSTVPNSPLFKAHTISRTNLPRVSSEDPTVSGAKLVSVQVVDAFYNAVKDPEIVIDYDIGVVYNNLANNYDVADGTATIYYVQYSVRIGNSVSSYVEILNNRNVYQVATFSDLTPFLTIKTDGRKVYLIEETAGGGYSVTLPISSTYAFKTQGTAKIEVTLHSAELSSQSPWIVDVTNATIFANGYKYHISEFDSQAWNPLAPIKLSADDLATVINSNTVRVNQPNIIESSDLGLYLSLQINDKNGNALAAFTTSPTLEGSVATNGATYKKWSALQRSGIRSIDYKTGFIDLDNFPLRETYEVIATYYFEENNYQFSLIDFNPLNNPDILDTMVVIFLDPDAVGSGEKSQTLYYMFVDKVGRVVQSNWYNYDNETEALLNGNPLFYDNIPSYLESVYPGAELFLENYTLNGNGPILVLAELYVNENSHPSKSKYFDVRQPGGGVRRDILDVLKARNPELTWYLDVGFFDGVPYPGNASYFVEVPAEILEASGGVFRTNQIKDVVARHTAAGVYPVVKAYGVDPSINSVVPLQNSIEIEWRSFPGILYNVYWGLSPEGPWTKATNTELADDESGNSYTISDLTLGTKYYFFVVGGKLNEDGIWTPIGGQPIGPGASPGIGLINPNMKAARTFAPNTNGYATLGQSFSVI